MQDINAALETATTIGNYADQLTVLTDYLDMISYTAKEDTAMGTVLFTGQHVSDLVSVLDQVATNLHALSNELVPEEVLNEKPKASPKCLDSFE